MDNQINRFNHTVNATDGVHSSSNCSAWNRRRCSSREKHLKRRLNSIHFLLNEERNYSNVLDIGCGNGVITASIKDRLQTKVTGIDVSPETIAFCLSTYKNLNVEFLEGDIMNLNFPDKQFDLVLTVSLIEWIRDYEKAISTVSRLLAGGGQWIVSLPNWRSPLRKMEYLRSLMVKKSYLNYQRNRVRIEMFAKTAQTYGLVLERSKYHVLPFIDLQINGMIGAWLHMMCMMSFRKIGEQHETTDAKT